MFSDIPLARIDEANDEVGEMLFSYCFGSMFGRVIVETIEVLRRGARVFTRVFFIMTKNIHQRRSRGAVITTYVLSDFYRFLMFVILKKEPGKKKRAC